MINLMKTTVMPLTLNVKVLDVAYDLYLKSPQESYPIINLREVAHKTGMSLLECRNAIVEANKLGRFPNCSLES